MTNETVSVDPVIADTPLGQLRGQRKGGVCTFLGVRYGEDTAKTRFRRANPVQAWSGVVDAFVFGDQCLQPETPDWELLRSGWDAPTGSSEDCLFLNIWTPAVNDGRRRPVMVNMHGGGWTIGNGNSAGRSGEEFARHHDIVRVNVNHRLGIFGFSNVDALLGPDYADSGNAGMLDIVLALEWVRDNILAFGGDPDNVTIFGVSGGGGKVSTLMAMPAAAGLFGRASVESGPMTIATLPAAAHGAAEKLVGALGLEDTRHILALSGEDLLAGYMKLYPDGGLSTAVTGPVMDGKNLPQHPFDPVAPEISSDVPLLIGTTTTETSIFLSSAFALGWDELAQRLPLMLPSGLPRTSDELIADVRQRNPQATPARVLFELTTEALIRSRSIRQAELASQRRAPVYMWLLEWETPVDGGKWGSPHGISVPFVMDTVSKVPTMFGVDLAEPLVLAEMMSSAWAQFARSGKPSAAMLPDWPVYEAENRATMIFDVQPRIEQDPDREMREVFAHVYAKPPEFVID